MSTQHIVDEVCRLLVAIFQCFYRRTKTQDYRPILESLSALQHLVAVGPMTVSEACLHFDRSQASMSELFSCLEARGLLDRMTQFTQQKMGKSAPTEARHSVLDFMSTMPAWQDHPDLLALRKKDT